MPEKMSPAPLGSAVSAIPPPSPPVYRSKKKLRMESHFFNTSLMTLKPHCPSIKMIETTETTFPTAKYTMNNNSWFKHVFGNEADNGATQASSASYNGKTFSGRPEHYGASRSGGATPTNLKGFSQMYKIGDNGSDVVIGPDFTKFSKKTPTLESKTVDADKAGISNRKHVKPKPTSPVATQMKKSKKRALPTEFNKEEGGKRGQARAHIEENWEFGRMLAKKQLLSLSRDSSAMEQWRQVGEQNVAQEQAEDVKQEDLSGDEQVVYEKQAGNKASFLYLQVDVVMPLQDNLVEMTPSP